MHRHKRAFQFRTWVERAKVRFHQVASARVKEVIPNVLVKKSYSPLNMYEFSLHLTLHLSQLTSDQLN